MRQQALIEIDGYLSKDGELRHTRDGRAVLGMSVAYTRRKRNQAGDWEDAGPTLWARFALWDDAAQAFADRMVKGTPVHVKGIPELRTWEKDGRHGVNLEILFAQVSIVADVPRREQQQAQQGDPADAWAEPGTSWDETPF
jgi:single-strand DNA-binding protein